MGPIERARGIAYRRVRGDQLSYEDEQFIAWIREFSAEHAPRCPSCRKVAHRDRDSADHQAAQLVLFGDLDARGNRFHSYRCPDGLGWHVSHSRPRSVREPPETFGLPSERFTALTKMSQVIRDNEGITVNDAERQLVRWAMEWEHRMSEVPICSRCGTFRAHSGAIGAAQHACYRILGGEGRLKLFQCRRGTRSLHIGK